MMHGMHILPSPRRRRELRTFIGLSRTEQGKKKSFDFAFGNISATDFPVLPRYADIPERSVSLKCTLKSMAYDYLDSYTCS